MKLYHSKRARSFRVLWMLEEMGLDYELEAVPFPPSRAEGFTALNPIGTVPLLVDGDVTMTESVAMLEYLGRRYGPTPLAPDFGAPSYPAYLDYLHFGESTLAAALSHLVRTRFMAPADQKKNWTATTIGEVFVARAGQLARVLDKGPHVAGADFTAADISVVYALSFGGRLGLTGGLPAVVHDYQARMTSRPAYLRAEAL